MTNKQVIEAWKKGEPGSSLNLMTDGFVLYSYGLKIGFTGEDRLKYVYNYTAHSDVDWIGRKVPGEFISQTTSAHIGLARRVAFAVNPPQKDN